MIRDYYLDYKADAMVRELRKQFPYWKLRWVRNRFGDVKFLGECYIARPVEDELSQSLWVKYRPERVTLAYTITDIAMLEYPAETLLRPIIYAMRKKAEIEHRRNSWWYYAKDLANRVGEIST